MKICSTCAHYFKFIIIVIIIIESLTDFKCWFTCFINVPNTKIANIDGSQL